MNVGSTSEVRSCGSSGTVTKCIRIALVKVDLPSIRDDVKLWNELSHPNLVRCLGLSEDSEYLYILLENCCGGNLKSRLKRRTCHLAQVKAMAQQLLSGLQYLHARQIAYGVLKPSHVLFQEDKTLLGDFASRKRGKAEHEQDIYYLAPESLDGKATLPADIWALGVTLYLAVTGRLPFNGIDREDVVQRIKFEEPDWQLLPVELRPLIQQCLKKEAEDRPTASEALAFPCLKV